MLTMNSGSSTFGALLMQADDGAMARCEQLYASQWRSAPFPASDLAPESLHEFEADLRFKAAVREVGPMPARHDEWAMEDWYGRVGALVDNLPMMITPETQLVSVLNYKGEDVGLVLFEGQVRDLPVFVSKTHSAAQFDA